MDLIGTGYFFNTKLSCPTQDTIAAVATPPGVGGIGIVRLSGPDSLKIFGKLWAGKRPTGSFDSHHLYCGKLGSAENSAAIDKVMACFMKGPRTYTGEDVVEIHCHGGTAIVRAVLGKILRAGARAAGPGEFTRRAFLNGRIDLAQAEAVADLIESKSEAAAMIFQRQLEGGLSGTIKKIRDELKELLVKIESEIDFPEEAGHLNTKNVAAAIKSLMTRLTKLDESYSETRKFHEGVRVAIVGRANVGKSSLLNQIIGEDRAIVDEMPGTTRDVIEETLVLQGVPVRFIDTAGIRGHAAGGVELKGIERTRERIKGADFIFFIVDQSEQWSEDDSKIWNEVKGRRGWIVLNKIDLIPHVDEVNIPNAWQRVKISALTGKGIRTLKQVFISQVVDTKGLPSEEGLITNLRQKQGVEKAMRKLGNVLGNISAPELASQDIKGAISSLGEIIGEVTTEEVLSEIFSRFCVGK